MKFQANKVLFVLLIFSTLLYSTKLPYAGYQGVIWLLSLFSLLLIAVNLGAVKATVKYHRYTLLFLLLLYGSMWVSAYASDLQSIAITFSKKYSIYTLVFFSFLILTYKKPNRLYYYRLVLRFLVVLAMFGIAEYLFPGLWLFSFLRFSGSLVIYPNISSLMQWHNQFGVLMSIGMLLVLILNNYKSIHIVEFYISYLSFLIITPLTGSRSAWLIFILGIFLAWLYKVIKLRGACIVIALFMLSILSFSHSMQRAGIKESVLFPLSNIIANNTKKASMDSILNNSSFELWISYNDTYAPKYWRYNNLLPILNLTRDAEDGIFSVQLKNNHSTISLSQNIDTTKWQHLYDNFHELEFRSLAKTKNTSVRIGLHLSNDKLLVSDPHTGDGTWHELTLRVKMSEFSKNTRPEVAKLIIPDPGTEVIFDNVILKGTGAKDPPSVSKPLSKELDTLNTEDIKITPPYSLFSSRIFIWKTAINEILKHPFTGSGMQTFQVKSKQAAGHSFLHTHNIFLNILFDLGIIGFLLSVTFIYCVFKKAEWHNPIVIIPVILVFAGQLTDCFIHDFTFTTIVLYFLAEAGNSMVSS